MKIAIIGTGYVGLVSGACFSEFGFDVTCIDNDAEKIARIDDGLMPIYEPGLEDLVERNVAGNRLHFSTEIGPAVAAADVVFIAVGTPARRGDGHADLTYVYAVAEEIATHLTGYTVVITKSTVPVGTGREVSAIIRKANANADFGVASNPEFLREGAAIGDFMRPDRVVVGTESDRAKDVLRALYRPLFLIETPIIFTGLETSELIKYASNAFLAVKISYINQMADLCEAIGADVHDVAKGIGLDKRIGSKFLHPGPGYGGSCFPKDTVALVRTAQACDVGIGIVDEVVNYNDARKQSMSRRVIDALEGEVEGKRIAILGLAFKPETDDMRDSPSLDVIPHLLAAGADISAYDPKAMDEASHLLPGSVHFVDSAEACICDADAVVLMTEWNEFRALTPELYINLLRGNVVVDLRNIYSSEEMTKSGLNYYSIGRPKQKKIHND